MIIALIAPTPVNTQTISLAQTPSGIQTTQGSTTPPPTTQPSGQTPAPTRPGTLDSGQSPTSTSTASPGQQPQQLSSAQFTDPAGFTVERLAETGFSRRADLLAARQRLAVAEGRLIQAGLRPNPTLDTDYGSARFLGGSAEGALDVGVTQVFETAGKRRKRVNVARTELDQVRAEVLAIERQFAADVRASYARAISAARQLDLLDRLIMTNEELVRVTNARLKEGDVAPLELNIVRVETDRLRAQVIRTRADIQGELISLRTLVGLETSDPLRLAPLPERPPRLDLNIAQLTDIALRERADLRAARLGEELGSARIRLAEAQRTPNVAGSVRYSRERRITDLPPSLNVSPVGQTDNILRFGVALDIPVFNKNQGEIASATGERVQFQRQREFLETTIKRDVALAYGRYRAAAETYVLYATRIIPTSEANVQSVRAAYNLGEFSVFDIVNEQRRLIESQTGYNDALRDYYGALSDLERALGTPLPSSGFAPASVSVLPDVNESNRGGELRVNKTSSLSTTKLTEASRHLLTVPATAPLSLSGSTPSPASSFISSKQ